MNRRPTTQDITWLLDLDRNKQLDLDPPYQRRSVWTPKDRQFFLDTIFRDYPSPAIFLHKTVENDGRSTYHVVDGKQRLETILGFASNKFRVAKDFGDVRLDGKKWSQLDSEPTLKTRFWNYQIPVEMVDVVDTDVVKAVFDRLNRNSRRLTEQELRHAKFEGWFITITEAEANKDDWTQFGIVTTARAKRMADAQFISELLMVIIKRDISGFDQDQLDDFYAKYDEPTEADGDFVEADFTAELKRIKDYLLEMDRTDHVVSRYARTLAHFYSLWSVIALHPQDFDKPLQTAAATATKYKAFMERIETLAVQKDAPATPATIVPTVDESAYYENSRGATTDLKPRVERHKALSQVLL